MHLAWFPRIERVALRHADLLRFTNELVDGTDWLLVGICSAKLRHQLEDLRLVHLDQVQMIAVLVDQIDVGGAQVPLHSIVKPCIRRPDVSGELGATLRVDAPRVSNGSPRLSSMKPSRLSDTATTQAAHARQKPPAEFRARAIVHRTLQLTRPQFRATSPAAPNSPQF